MAKRFERTKDSIEDQNAKIAQIEHLVHSRNLLVNAYKNFS